MKLRPGPTFVSPLPSAVDGVDFLGVAAVNENLVGLCLPGISTYTRYLRVYSTMSWMAWRFTEFVREETAKRRVSEKELAGMFRRFREKVEILFSLGNASYGEIAGSSRRAHLPKDKKRFALEFEPFGAMAISWLDAAVYGPSLHSLSGLGFLERAPGRSHRPTDFGVEIALALDVSLQKSEFYKQLSDIADNIGSVEMIDDLAQRWAVRESTAKERSCFRKAFFPPTAGEEGPHNLPGNRVAMGRLITRSLRALGGRAQEDDVRRAITRGITPKGKSIDVSECAKTRGIWSVLQLRQLQRVAYEGLLRWVEATLLEPPAELKGRSAKALCDLAASQAVAHLDAQESDALGPLFSRLGLTGGRDYFLHGMKESKSDPFVVLDGLIETSKQVDNSKLPAACVHALVLCALQTQAFMQQDHHRIWISSGGPYRLSLKSLLETFKAYETQSIGAFVRFLIESCVIGQHLKITNGKGIEPNKNKFRFMPQEDGIRLFIRPSQKTGLGTTGDRLENAMELMGDCGILVRDSKTSEFVLVEEVA